MITTQLYNFFRNTAIWLLSCLQFTRAQRSTPISFDNSAAPERRYRIRLPDDEDRAALILLPTDALTALDSDGPLHPTILHGLDHGPTNGDLVTLDWYGAPWMRDVNGRPHYRALDVEVALSMSIGAVSTRLTCLVERIGQGHYEDVLLRYRGALAFMLFVQARENLMYQLTLQVADELYPTDPRRLRASIDALRGRFDPITLFEAAVDHNDGLLMLLTASHAMYLHRSTPTSAELPLGNFTHVNPSVVMSIRACASLVGELVAAHMSKGRFQWWLLQAARCDLNTLADLHSWRARPMINPEAVIPPVSLGCDAVDTYGQAFSTCASINDVLSTTLPGAGLRTRLRGLLAVYPGRRGPCYQVLYQYMAMRVRDATRWGLFPPPLESPHGNDDSPCRDTRRYTLPVQETRDFPCHACLEITRDFLGTQLAAVSQLLRDALKEGSSNYYAIDVRSIREDILRCEGLNNSPLAIDLEHVFDDVIGPYSHPNLVTGNSIEIPGGEEVGGWGAWTNGGW